MGGEVTLARSEVKLVSKNRVTPIWCPGCGDYGVLQSLVRALQELNKRPEETVIVSGIGCSGRLPYFVDAYGFHTLHGRALPIAMGVKLADPGLTVIVVGGDGDGFGIGGGHIPHMARRNVDLTYLVLDNGVYALTKGHSSPTTYQGQRTPSARGGEELPPLDIVGMLLAYRTSFVARGWSGDRPGLTDILRQAIIHPGFAVVHILSPCPTFNLEMSFDRLREDVEPLPEDYDPTDLRGAILTHYTSSRPRVGVIYRDPHSQPFTVLSPMADRKKVLSALIERYA